MASDPKVPPSLSRLSGAATADESEKDARRRKVEEALRALLLADDAKKQVFQFLPLFETTYDGVNDDRPISAAQVRQLSDMVRLYDKLATHLTSMDQDAIRLWGRAGGIRDDVKLAANFLKLRLVVQTGVSWAEVALAVAKANHRPAKRGKPVDAIAAALGETTAFVYTKLTGKRAGRRYDAYENKERDTEFIELLRRIYEAYGVKASARYRVRQRRRPMDDNSKK